MQVYAKINVAVRDSTFGESAGGRNLVTLRKRAAHYAVGVANSGEIARK